MCISELNKLLLAFKLLLTTLIMNSLITITFQVMRHGIRTPASTYPKDPYINETFYPVGWGQITNV